MYGEHHILVAESLNNIGLLLYMQGLYEDAYPLYEQSLIIKEQAYNNHVLSVTDLPGNKQNQRPENDSPMFAADAKREDTSTKIALHNHNISLATSYHNLAILCHKIGKLDEAKRHYEKAITIRTAFLGEQHPDTSIAKENMRLLVTNPTGGGVAIGNIRVLPDGSTAKLTDNSYRKVNKLNGKTSNNMKSDWSDVFGNPTQEISSTEDGEDSFVTLGQESDISFAV